MKRYLLFGGWQYYPSGGMDDFIGDFSNIEDALEKSLENKNMDWFQIYDTIEMKIIKEW